LKKGDPKGLVILVMIIALWSVITHIKEIFSPPLLIKDMRTVLLMLIGSTVPGLIAYSLKNIRQKTGFYCMSMGLFLDGMIHLTRGQYFFNIINLLTIISFSISLFTLLYDFLKRE